MVFIPAHTVINAAAGTPARALYLLHGILGSQRHWKPFARRLAAACPDLGVVLVDHRQHGRSRGAPGPHTLDACAADLRRLGHHLGAQPAVVCGHSFGGKVALVYAMGDPAGLEAVWVLDCPPGPGGGEGGDPLSRDLQALLPMLRQGPLPLAHRLQAAAALRARGVPEELARWMTTNLEPDEEGGYRWSFDQDAAEHMLEDYWRRDLRPFLERPPLGLLVHLVRGELSQRWTSKDLEHLHGLSQSGQVRVHLLQGAGHWLQADNPEGLVSLMRPWLASAPS